MLAPVRVIRRSRAERTLVFGELRVTAEHPLWANGTWKPAGSVARADRLLDTRLRDFPAETPRVIEEPIEVYDMTIDAPHCYFAGGFLVHNKDPMYVPRLDDPWYNLWMEPTEPKRP